MSSPAAVREALQEMQKAIRALELKNEKLAYELAHLKRIRFGRANETLNTEQRPLFEDDLDGDIHALESEQTPTEKPAVTCSRAGRQALPAHLERI